jgi:hypothetical protein
MLNAKNDSCSTTGRLTKKICGLLARSNGQEEEAVEEIERHFG